MLRSLFGALARKIGVGYVELLPGNSRMEVIETITERQVAEIGIPSGTLKFQVHTPLLLSRAQSLLTKERDTIAWIDAMGADDVLWDIGANVGVYSLYAAAQAKCRVLAFEPSAANYLVLSRNVEANGLGSRVAAYCVAFAGATELGVLNMASAAVGTAMSQFGSDGEMSRYWKGKRGAAHGMIGFTIDEFVERFAPPFPTHLKIDVDGLEWPILQGARRTLGDARLKTMIVELSLTDQAERTRSMDLLTSCGLRLSSQGEMQGVGEEKAANHLFVRARG